MFHDSSPPRATLRDLAKAVGLSVSTVSRALNGHPRISAGTRALIQDKAESMGYHPNPTAVALIQQRLSATKSAVTDEIAWINTWPEPRQLRKWREFDLYWKGAFETAERCGYRLEEFTWSEGRLQRALVARGVRGILLPPYGRTRPNLEGFGWSSFAVVRFGYSVSHPPVHMVTSDQLSNSLLAMERIREKGYRRVGFISSTLSNTRHRAGYAMAQANLPKELQLPTLNLVSGESDPCDIKMLEKWLRRNMPDAILTDITKCGDMLARLGYRIPGDVGLAALSVLDGEADAGIYQNSEEIGRAAMELLILQLQHHKYGIPAICRELLIQGSWVDGQSLPRRDK